MRVKREENEFVETPVALEGCNGVCGEGLPVTHSGHSDRVDEGFKSFDEPDALALRENADG